jgi:hypothetical protein
MKPIQGVEVLKRSLNPSEKSLVTSTFYRLSKVEVRKNSFPNADLNHIASGNRLLNGEDDLVPWWLRLLLDRMGGVTRLMRMASWHNLVS